MSRFLPVGLLLVAGGAALAADPDPTPIGKVVTVAGASRVNHLDGTEDTLARGSPLFQGDRVLTGPGAGLGVELIDATAIVVDGNSEIGLDEFGFDFAEQAGSLALSIRQGIVVMVSGLVAKADPGALVVTTPRATAAVRGTQFGVAVDSLRTTITLMIEDDTLIGEIEVRSGAVVQVMNTGNQTVVIPASGTLGAIAGVTPSQIRTQFGTALRHLPRNMANPY